ncbi:HAMP domain-containing sensor histidine kinase [Enterovirga sp.]|uniref:sensor histidine kinase n=1 Tax=Enterovirga sp. TaxID=2026350 RepID=UPI002D0666BE|nr:HAMP domain-containing sensor histidine kinase [Enterovirga sp.]HMO30550.1 HAMP domain-containing sensor histidine kinase [Enterovirga sp.]
MGELTAEMVEQGRDATFSDRARRRRLAQDIRTAREKLTSSIGLERTFEYELVRVYAENQARAAIVVLALAGVVAGVSTYWISTGMAGIWFVLVSAILAIRYGLVERFLRTEPDSASIAAWRRRFIVTEFVFTCGWAPAIKLLADVEGGTYGFTLFVSLMIAAVTTTLSSSVPLAVCGGLVPLALVVALIAVTSRDAGASVLAVMTTTAFVFLTMLSNRLYESTLSSIRSRAEKDHILVELEEAKGNSDEARRRAEEANLAKSRFLATMSHELRTPLNAIMGFSEVMMNEVFGPHAAPSYKDYSKDIHESGQHLLTLINEILDLSRIEAGRYELTEEAVHLGWVVSDARHMLALRAKAKGQSVQEIIAPSLPRLWADERAVRQIVLNILSNAIKFTPPGGTIVIKVGWTSSGGQYVNVKDSGPGIPEEEIPIVMSSFGRGSLAIKTAEQGSGLGLPIVKGLVDLLGGGFQIRSRPREGTEVIVTFPASRVMDTLAPVQLDGEAALPARRARAS